MRAREGEQAHLQQLLKKRNEVRPFVHIVERGETFFHLLRVLLEFWIVPIDRG